MKIFCHFERTRWHSWVTCQAMTQERDLNAQRKKKPKTTRVARHHLEFLPQIEYRIQKTSNYWSTEF